MAPAGDMPSLRAALNAGADAVYFGASIFNMRSRAKNFSADQMLEIVKICHENKAKAYLTLNTIIFETELEQARSLVKLAAEADVDAIICWDFSIAEFAGDYGIPIFFSTQASVSNSASIQMLYKNFGIKRFVLARECTLEEIELIKRNLTEKGLADKIELEVFIHGAMCVSVSGRCFLSHFHFGDSGNRGNCRQPCRREYEISEVRDGKSYLLGKDYIMSPKDLCTLPFLEKILEAGPESLKIEGRGRSPEYVSIVTGCYRQFIDFYYENCKLQDFANNLEKLKKILIKKLDSVFNRGFSDGYFMGRQIESWTGGNGSKATHRKVQIGIVTNFYKKPMVAEIKVEDNGFTANEELMFIGNTTGVAFLKAVSIEQKGRRIDIAAPGNFVGVKLDQIVRRNDRVFKMVPVEELKNVQQ
jgi:putative protease